MSSKRKKKYSRPTDSPVLDDNAMDSGPAATPSNRPRFKLRLPTFFAVLIIVVAGALTYTSGMGGEFMGDDATQIVNNIPVHSISNVVDFFKGGTFYNPGSLTKLSSSFYRPLMTTSFSVIYSVFGPNPMAFHIAQLGVFLAGAIMLFLVLRYFFNPLLALVLTLVFVVHPINSQLVYSISAMQEPLFFFFGMLAMWTLLRFQDDSPPYLLLTAGCLFLSILSKETGVLFFVMALTYAFITNRKNFKLLLGISAGFFCLYLLLRIPAIGLIHASDLAPLDRLGIGQRLFSLPAILLFYIGKVIFPLDLAHNYFWAHKSISFEHVVLPLLIDGALIALAIFLGLRLKKRDARDFVVYLFFSIWLGIGLMLHSQILPLDFTVSETWFIFPFVGLLGMAGVFLERHSHNLLRPAILTAIILLVSILSVRSVIRGLDYKDAFTLASHDISVSKEDYVSENVLADYYINSHDYSQAIRHAQRSVDIFPASNGYYQLGLATGLQGDLPKARSILMTSLKYGTYNYVLERISLTYIYDPSADIGEGISFIKKALNLLPEDHILWVCLAALENKVGDIAGVNHAIEKATQYGPITAAEHKMIYGQ